MLHSHRMQNHLFVAATNNSHKIQEIQEIFHGDILTPREIGIKDFAPLETALTFEGNATIKAHALLDRIKESFHTLCALFPNKTRLLILADDSGLCVDVLAGLPGIYSARYATLCQQGLLQDSCTNDVKNREALKRALLHKGFVASQAFFQCCIAYIIVELDSISQDLSQCIQGVTHGTCDGVVAVKECGEYGFGYDSMFYSEYDKGLFMQYAVPLDSNDSNPDCMAYGIPIQSSEYFLESLKCSFACLLPQQKNVISHRFQALLQLRNNIADFLS
ncbi:non-canonical purine NTP pyrophosphatase [Helicobacter aurati]|uniref:Non-canonical purine NTP pyrophosphatase n=1 Tax=Helicobacter aurati TaxID=137778 RepID=A0A3D8J0D6_9HELI|nr:non-canonical purine NTP pyrophosphatase [Helicobacter aurati]RDU70251.1 non-canonical purine NTP pyrophosphatase [Helicobacter aurati]